MNGSSKPDIYAMNIWRIMTDDHELDSHKLRGIRNYARHEPIFFSPEIKNSMELPPDKVLKHLNLKSSKPKLFAAFEQFATSLIEADLYEMVNKVQVFDPAMKNPESRLVFSSHYSQEYVFLDMEGVSHYRENQKDVFYACLGFNDPVSQVIARVKAIEHGRDWDLIARAATVLLRSDTLSDEAMCSRMEKLTGIDRSQAEAAATECLRSTRHQAGLFADNRKEPAPRRSKCRTLPCSLL